MQATVSRFDTKCRAHQRRMPVVVTPDGIPAPTGHDKTSIVSFQRHDRPGSLLAILQEFAARANLTGDAFIAELAKNDIAAETFRDFEARGEFPALTIICLPNDHTSGTTPGAPAPAAGAEVSFDVTNCDTGRSDKLPGSAS